MSSQQTTVMEQTAKRWKAQQIAAFFICLLGVSLWPAGEELTLPWLADHGLAPAAWADPAIAANIETAGLVILILGAAVYAHAIFMAWWRHG